MSLVDIPLHTRCHVQSVARREENLKYIMAGINQGSSLRVLCRHPDTEPKFFEVELEDAVLITLPLIFAKEVTVEAVEQGKGGLK